MSIISPLEQKTIENHLKSCFEFGDPIEYQLPRFVDIGSFNWTVSSPVWTLEQVFDMMEEVYEKYENEIHQTLKNEYGYNYVEHVINSYIEIGVDSEMIDQNLNSFLTFSCEDIVGKNMLNNLN